MLSSPPLTREEAVSFECQGDHLMGVLTLPPRDPPTSPQPSDLALLVIVGGPQVRSGSHRQFTRLCRTVAAAGVPAMRFDVRGMGDSTGQLHDFEHIGPDIATAIDALQRRLPHVRRVVLWGLCDGASAALIYLHERHAGGRADTRVAGLVLLNPWVRSAQTLARAHVKHYYWNRLREVEFWRKLLRGGVAGQAVKDLVGNLRAARAGGGGANGPAEAVAATFQERMLQGAERFYGPVLWVLSGQDYTAKEFVELVAAERRWQQAMKRPVSQRLDLDGADHTFSNTADEQLLAGTMVSWLDQTLFVGRP